jgi:hypothetical protein
MPSENLAYLHTPRYTAVSTDNTCVYFLLIIGRNEGSNTRLDKI